MLQSIPDAALFPTCVLGIYTCYFTYGYLQEELIAVEQISAGVPLFMQYLTALLVSLGVKLFLSETTGTKFKLVRFKELRIGFINNCSMFGSNYALKYVDYPTQALFKSSKILPVMGIGLIRRTYSYALYKYICAGVITLGLVVFNIAKLGSKVSTMTINTTGLCLLFFSLFFDGLVATQTDKDKNKGEKSTPFDLMFANNVCGIISSSLVMLSTYFSTGEFILNEITLSNFDELLIIALAGTIGQIIVYITINRFDCFILSVVNTSRKFFSILFSIVYFSHPISFLHWVGITLVIGSISADVFLSHKQKQQKKRVEKKMK